METKITRNQLITVVEALAELVDNWNDSSMDYDRGRDNNALCLLIWDDGSGRLGTQWGDVFNKQMEFDNPGELADQLVPWLDFVEDDELRALRELREVCGMYCEQLPVEVREALHAVPEIEKTHSHLGLCSDCGKRPATFEGRCNDCNEMDEAVEEDEQLHYERWLNGEEQ